MKDSTTETTDLVLRTLADGHRSQRWRADLLCPQEFCYETLDGIDSGSIEYSIHKTIRSGGNLTVRRPIGSPAIDWNRSRIHLFYLLDLPDGTVWEMPLGLFIPGSATDAYSGTDVVTELELYDKSLILDQDATMDSWGFDKGTNAVEAIRATLDSALGPEDWHAIEDSSETLTSAIFWEAGESKLRIVNDLLDAINYFALEADGNGVLRGKPYVGPAYRAVTWTFADDEEGIYLPDFTHDQDHFSVPNRMVVVGTSDGEEEAPVSFALNEDPDSPYSFQSRGRWISRVDTGTEATSQAVLDRIAQRRLAELTLPSSSIEITHAIVPLSLNGAVTFTRSDAHESDNLSDVRAVVQRYTIKPGDTGSLAETTLRRVVA